jgi:hypothetical protein
VIDWLVRKPGAFENYRYREEQFPTSRFRLAYDDLAARSPLRASKEYLRILELAARGSESAVDAALHRLLAQDRPIRFEAVEALTDQGLEPSWSMEIAVAPADLSAFDELLTDKEVENDSSGADQGLVDRTPQRPAPADVS